MPRLHIRQRVEETKKRNVAVLSILAQQRRAGKIEILDLRLLRSKSPGGSLGFTENTNGAI
jgi:hypothetical protein